MVTKTCRINRTIKIMDMDIGGAGILYVEENCDEPWTDRLPYGAQIQQWNIFTHRDVELPISNGGPEVDHETIRIPWALVSSPSFVWNHIVITNLMMMCMNLSDYVLSECESVLLKTMINAVRSL